MTVLALHHPPSHRGRVEHLLLLALLAGLRLLVEEGRAPPRQAVLAAQLADRRRPLRLLRRRLLRRRRARLLERLLPECLLLLRLVRVRGEGLELR